MINQAQAATMGHGDIVLVGVDGDSEVGAEAGRDQGAPAEAPKLELEDLVDGVLRAAGPLEALHFAGGDHRLAVHELDHEDQPLAHPLREAHPHEARSLLFDVENRVVVASEDGEARDRVEVSDLRRREQLADRPLDQQQNEF